MTRQTFKTTDVLRLEVAQTPAGLVNQIKNPPDVDFLYQNGVDGGGHGWTQDASFGPFQVRTPTGRTDQWVSWTMLNGVANQFYSEPWAHAAGEYGAARMQAAAFSTVVAWYRLSLEWINAAGAVFATSAASAIVQGTRVDTTGGALVSLGAQLAPAGTVKARLRVDLFGNSSGTAPTSGGTIYFKDVTAAKAGTSAALTGLPVISASPTWTNVIGPTHTITVTRAALNLGTLTAEILDATIDPSQSTLVRPGKRVRLMALNNATATWTPLFVGRIARGETTYDPKRTDVKRARVSLTAVDSIPQLAQASKTVGVTDFPYAWKILEGAGVPWRLTTVNTPVVTYATPSRPLLDQIGMVRDSVLGYAWVDRRGILVLSRKVDMPTGAITTLSESTYSDLAIDYDTDRCINVVNVKLRRVNLATGLEVEVPYGPYVDQASFDQWGAHSADFTVVGITDSDAAASAYAAPILAANATPAVRINSVEIPIRDAADIVTTRALLDLYDLVTVSNTNAAISQDMRVDSLEHKIQDGKWQLSLTFAAPALVAVPTISGGGGPRQDRATTAAPGAYPAAVAIGGVGPFGTTVPGPTSGIAFDCAAGVFRGQVAMTGFTAATAGALSADVYIDGVNKGTIKLANTNSALGAHTSFGPFVFAVTLAAGTHYFAIRQTAGTSDANDNCTLFGVVTPT